LLAGEAAHHGVVDFEQRPQAVPLARQLLFVSLSGLVIQGVIHSHGHLARHVLHEFDVFGRIGVLPEGAEVEAAQVPLGGE
jgi:hypothetical protein